MPRKIPKSKLIYYKDEQRLFRWKLIAPNGQTVAASSESFTRRYRALDNFKIVQRILGKGTFEVYLHW